MKDFISFYEESKSNDIFIILGAQGSGTNLLSNILEIVFDCSVIKDRSLIFNSAINIYRDQSNKTIHRELRRIYSSFFPNRFSKYLGPSHYHHRSKHFVGFEKYLGDVKIRDAEDFVYFFACYHAYSNGKSRLAFKSDDMWENIEFAEKIYKKKKYIHLVRDFRDNVLSVINKNFGPKTVYVCSHYIKERVNAYHQETLRNRDVSILLTYEELLEHPQKCIIELSEALGLGPVSDLANKIEALNIRTTSLGRWKNQMAEDELLVCETILQDELREFGYPITSKTLMPDSLPVRSAKHTIHDMVLRVSQKIKRYFKK